MKLFNNLSIWQKLVGGFCLSAVIVLIVGGVGFIGITNNVNNLQRMDQINLVEYMAFEELQTIILQNRRYEKDFFLNIGNKEKQEKYFERFKKATEKTLGVLKKLDTLRSDVSSDEAKLRKEYKENYQAYTDGFLTIAQQVFSDPSMTARKANTVLMKPIKENIYKAEKNLASLMDIAVKTIRNIADEMVFDGKKIKMGIGVLLPAGFFLSLIMGMIIAKKITRPISLGIDFAQEVAKGNLSLEVDKKILAQKDEMGQLASAMNAMSMDLGKIFTNILSSSKSLSTSSVDLASISSPDIS